MGVEAVLGEALQGAAGAGQGRRQPRLQVRVYPLLDQEGPSIFYTEVLLSAL